MPEASEKPKKAIRTVDLKPGLGEMLKPAEAIDIIGTEKLTLQDRRIWNTLIAEAFGPKMAEHGREFKIALSMLRERHKGNERIDQSIERLMATVVRCRRPDGRTSRFQLLGGNDMGSDSRDHGFLTYSFDRRLVDVLGESTLFGKLELSVMAAFQSKYALALYEHLSRRVGLKHVWMAEHTVDEMREILGVPRNRLKPFGSLKQKAIDPALAEINALAPFTVHMAAKRTGRKITAVTMAWHWKDREGRNMTRAELDRSKTGRKARIQGTAEGIVESSPDLFDDSARPIA